MPPSRVGATPRKLLPPKMNLRYNRNRVGQPKSIVRRRPLVFPMMARMRRSPRSTIVLMLPPRTLTPCCRTVRRRCKILVSLFTNCPPRLLLCGKNTWQKCPNRRCPIIPLNCTRSYAPLGRRKNRKWFGNNSRLVACSL